MQLPYFYIVASNYQFDLFLNTNINSYMYYIKVYTYYLPKVSISNAEVKNMSTV